MAKSLTLGDGCGYVLLELRVKNLGIIEDMTWRLHEGLNVITGETGAGKSLVIDAVELLLSGLADESAIRYGAEAAQIEGVFAIAENERFKGLRELLAQKELVGDEQTLVINCQLRRKGHSIVRVNSHAVPRTLLHQIGRLLVDIHGQSQHLSLLDTAVHLNFLDSYANTTGLLTEFIAKVTGLRRVEHELSDMEKDEQERARREEFLRFQIDEITHAELHDGEEEALEKERHILTSAEKIKALADDVYRALYEDDDSSHAPSALDRLNESIQAMKRLADLDPSLAQQSKFVEDTIYGLTEVARDVHAYGDRSHFDPERMAEIESRIDQIKHLKRKYGQSVREILDYQTKAETELATIVDYAGRRAQLEKELKNYRQDSGRIASQLSQERCRAAVQLESAVKKELQDLNLAQVDFRVAISQQLATDGLPFPDGHCYSFKNDGADIVEFMISTNPGEPMKPLAKIASTGEMSRFTLALKSALSESDNIPVLVFDEIELGIGGRSGETIGEKLWLLARNRQVICVTHLPQIAALADAHFSVHKVTSGTRTMSLIEKLEDGTRTNEIAAMLAGPDHNESVLRNARDLMRNAQKWKAAYHK